MNARHRHGVGAHSDGPMVRKETNAWRETIFNMCEEIEQVPGVKEWEG